MTSLVIILATLCGCLTFSLIATKTLLNKIFKSHKELFEEYKTMGGRYREALESLKEITELLN